MQVRLNKGLMVLTLALTAWTASAQVALNRPRLGVSLHPGVAISGVDAEFTAAKAGLKAGDYIIRCGESDVANLEGLKKLLDEQKPGTAMPLTVLRGGEPVELTVQFPAAFNAGEPRLGADPESGVLVLGTEPGSPAAGAGLERGDLIQSLDGKSVTDVKGLQAAVAAVPAGKTVPVVVRRMGDEGAKTIALQATFGAAGIDVGPAPAKTDHDEDEDDDDDEDEADAPIVLEDVQFDDHGPAGGLMPGFPGMDALTSLLDAPNLVKDLDAALEELKALDAGPKVEKIITKVSSVRDRLSRISSSVAGLSDMAKRFMDDFGGGHAAELAPHIADIKDRIQELMQEGVTVEKLRQIIAEEFPGVMVEFGEPDKEPAAPTTPKPATEKAEKKSPEAPKGGSK